MQIQVFFIFAGNMKHIQYQTEGTCSLLIDVVADDNDVIQQVAFMGGCNGKGTSCPDQLCRALEQLKK